MVNVPGWVWICSLPESVSQSAEIVGMQHHIQLHVPVKLSVRMKYLQCWISMRRFFLCENHFFQRSYRGLPEFSKLFVWLVGFVLYSDDSILCFSFLTGPFQYTVLQRIFLVFSSVSSTMSVDRICSGIFEWENEWMHKHIFLALYDPKRTHPHLFGFIYYLCKDCFQISMSRSKCTSQFVFYFLNVLLDTCPHTS